MTHPLEKRLEQLRRRVRGVITLYGLSWLVGSVVAATLAVGFVDWLVHLNDTGVRLILGLSIVALAGWTTYRFLVLPLLTRLRLLEIALRVERRFPEFEDRLASTVDFLHTPEDDPDAGSAELRRAVIQETLDRAEKIDFRDVVQTSQVRRVAIAALAICALTGVVIWASPANAQLALARLVNPFADNPWPKLTHLKVLKAPGRLARGDAFEVRIGVERGSLPSKGTIHYQFEDGETASEPMRLLNETLVANFESVDRSFQFRVAAGDDLTDWQSLAVVPPPVAEGLRLRLTFPAYTGREPEDLAEGVGHIRVLRGTRVELRATTNKPVTFAAVHLKDDTLIPAEITADGRHFSAEFAVEAKGSYWIELEDTEGFRNRRADRYEIQAITDQAPQVVIEKPLSDIEVTTRAVLPIRTLAKDDYGLDTISLHYQRPVPERESTEQETRDIGVEPGAEGAEDSGESVVSLFEGEQRPLRQVIDHLWDLEPLGLTHGQLITFRTQATDFDNLHGPNVGKSRELRLRVVSDEQLARRIEERQAQLGRELKHLLELEERSNSQVQELRTQLEKVGDLAKGDLDNLQRAQIAQRQVTQGLTGRPDGVVGEVDRLLEDLENNQIDDSETRSRLAQMADEIARLGRDHLPQIEQRLTEARKSAQIRAGDATRQPGAEAAPQKSAEGSRRSATPQGDSPAEGPDFKTGQPEENDGKGTPTPARPEAGALADAAWHQEEVIDSLRSMLEELSQWEDHRSVARELSRIIKKQEELIDTTNEVGRNTLTKKLENLSRQEQADLARVGGHQQELSERLNRLERKMERVRDELQERDPLVADAFADSLAQARRDATVSQLGQAARDIEANRVGQASRSQQQGLRSLEQMLEVLQNRGERQLARLVKKLKEAERELKQLRQEQAAQLERTQKAGKNADPEARRRELKRLAQRQRQLQREAERFARKLERLRAQRAGKSTRQAAGKMDQAGQGLDQQQAGDAAEREEEAMERLEEAQQQLAQARREAEEELAREILATIADSLKQLHEQQKKVVTETQRLEALRIERGRLTRGQLAGLRNLADNQKGLHGETSDLVEKLTAAEVFALALRGASRNMNRAAERLNEKRTDQETQAAEQRAVDRLAQLLDALKPEKPKPGAGQQGGGGGGGGGGGDGIPSLAQLKLLRALQTEINDRTGELDEKRLGQQGLEPGEQTEYQQLGEEQGSLADLVRNLTAPSKQAEE